MKTGSVTEEFRVLKLYTVGSQVSLQVIKWDEWLKLGINTQASFCFGPVGETDDQNVRRDALVIRSLCISLNRPRQARPGSCRPTAASHGSDSA
jgi:hypothetical protein